MPEWVKDAPPLVLMLLVVGMFLRHLQAEGKAREAQSERCHASHGKTVEGLKEVLERNNDLIHETKKTIGENTTAILRLNGGHPFAPREATRK